MRKASKATSDVADQANRVGDSSTKFHSGVEQGAKSVQQWYGRLMAVGAAAGVAAAGVMELVNTAGQLEQSIGATKSVFKDASGTIDDFAEDSVDAVGLSERAYRELAAVAGAQLKSLGFSVEEAAQTSNQLVTIGADLAATFGGTTEEAVSALGAAFRGEADPAERFGLRLNQTAVNAKAVEMGLAASASEVDANAKAQATLALIMEQSADSTGQFARESDTLAGAQQRATAQFEDAKAALGERLMPAVASVTTQFSNLLQVVSDPSWEGGFDLMERGILQMVAAANPIVGGAVSAALGATGKAQQLNAEMAQVATLSYSEQKDALASWVEQGVMTEAQADALAASWIEQGSAARGSSEDSRDNAEALKRAEEANKELQEAIDGVTAATFAAIDSDFGFRRAVEATDDAVTELAEKQWAANNTVDDASTMVDEAAAAQEDYSDSLLGAEGSILAQADAAVRMARDTAEAAGQTFGAAEETATYRWELENLKAKFPELAPVIDAHIAKLDAVPENVQTNLHAQADLGSVDAALAAMQTRADAGVLVAPKPGQVVRRARGGIDAMIADNPTVLWGERETGGEAFIPRKGISKNRATSILGQAANWYGYGLMELAQGGLIAPMKMKEADWYWANAPELSAGIGWQAMWAALSNAMPWVRLLSSFRPGAITATGNASYHGMGRAIDVSPSMDVFNWIKGNYGGSKEIIYSPAGGGQVRNGGPHMYGEPTRGDHWDHVHWAMAHGGILGGGQQQRVTEVINVMLSDGSVLAQTQRTYDRYNTGR